MSVDVPTQFVAEKHEALKEGKSVLLVDQYIDAHVFTRVVQEVAPVSRLGEQTS